jgi:hypothetical protein
MNTLRYVCPTFCLSTSSPSGRDAIPASELPPCWSIRCPHRIPGASSYPTRLCRYTDAHNRSPTHGASCMMSCHYVSHAGHRICDMVPSIVFWRSRR